MFRVYGKPPFSEFVELKQNPPLYDPPHTDSVKLFGTEEKKLFVKWPDGSKSELVQQAPNYKILGKNRIINGDFLIWQRGTYKYLTPSAGYFTADRWRIDILDGNYTEQRNSMYGYYSKKVSVSQVPSGPGPYYIMPFVYRFEGIDLFDLASQQKTVTLSFLFRSNVAGYFSVAFHNTGGSNYNASFVADFLYSNPDYPAPVEIQIPLNATFNPLANNESLNFQLVIAPDVAPGAYETPSPNQWVSGAYLQTSRTIRWATAVNNYVEITAVQLEAGAMATEFEKLPYQIQLYNCMRYFEKSKESPVPAGTVGWNGLHGLKLPVSGNGLMIPPPVRFLVEKRVIPTVTVYSGSTGNSGVVVVSGVERPVTIDYVSRVGFRAYWSDTSTSKGEIWFQWFADAEL